MVTKRERILRALHFEEPDRIPLLGGWIIDDSHHIAITGCTDEAYWQDPTKYSIKAHRALDVDGMIQVLAPKVPGGYRNSEYFSQELLESVYERYRTPEDVLAFVRSQPEPEELARAFDAEAWRDEFRIDILAQRERMGDMVYMPTLWGIVHPEFEQYWKFGYENYLLFMHLYPEAADRFFAGLAAVARRKADVVAGLYQELDMVPLTLIGTDICGGGGPLISPGCLCEFYFPHVRRSLEPLHEAGVKTVWHSDGDFRPILEDILSCGVSGFQGFQEEYGVDIADIARHRTVDGEKLVIFAGPSVTTTLPFGTVDDVERDVERVIDALAGKCALFILPANNVLPDCPVENILALHRHAIEYSRARHVRDSALRLT
jgi:hypothetical protein